MKNSLIVPVMAAAIAMTLGTTGAAAEGPAPDRKAASSSAAAQAVPVDAAARAAGAEKASPSTEKAAAALRGRLMAHVAKHGTDHTFGTYADAATDTVVLETDAPAEVVKGLVGQDRAEVSVRKTQVKDSWHRRDDIPAYYGGAGIRNATGICSAGYTVRNSAGTNFMVTAGHCFANGQTAVTELGGRVFGTVSGNSLPSRDMELIGGQSYANRIYLGGVNSTTSARVASAADPVVGFNNYCHSGRTTGTHCGHTVTSVSATVCTASGCKSPVIAFTGGVMIQPGDSGGSFFVNSSGTSTDKHIRGHVIASGGGTGYAEKWSRVQARYGVSIVT